MKKTLLLCSIAILLSACAQKLPLENKVVIKEPELMREEVKEVLIDYTKTGLSDIESPASCLKKRGCTFSLPVQKCISYTKTENKGITNLKLSNDCSHEVSLLMEVKGFNGKEVLPAINLEDILMPGAEPVLRVRDLKEEIIRYNVNCFSKKTVEANMKIKLFSGGATIKNGSPQCLYTTL